MSIVEIFSGKKFKLSDYFENVTDSENKEESEKFDEATIGEDISDLETEENAEKKPQKGQELKIVIPSQLFPRLLTLLAQKK